MSIETGSYDAALFDAAIADMNVMKYTSVLPVNTKIVERKSVSLEHGAVLEAIMAQADGRKYDTITAGIMYVRVRRRSDGTELGGYVVEYPSSDAGEPGTPPSGINVTEDDAKNNLLAAMKGLLHRRYGHNWEDRFEIYNQSVAVHSIANITDDWASVIVALGVADYTVPVLDENDRDCVVVEDRIDSTDYRVKYGMFL